MRTVEEDIKSWAIDHVEKHGDKFPICPYAKKAWFENQVKVIETEDDFWDVVNEEVDNFNDDHQVVIVAQQEPFCEYEDLEISCMALNRWFAQKEMNIWLLSFQHDITMVFIQRLSKLDDASAKLLKKGYYDNYDDDDFDNLIAERSARRLYDARNDAWKKEAHENDAWWCS